MNQYELSPLEFRCLIQAPGSRLLAALYDATGREVRVRASDALLAPDIAPRLTQSAKAKLVLMLTHEGS